MRLITGVIGSRFARRLGVAGTILLLLGGCQAIALTAAGIGASTGLTHTVDSIASRTFTSNQRQVKQATLIAMGKMGMKLESSEKSETGEVVRASLPGRSIEIVLTPLSETVTRINTTAQRSVFLYDGATAREIVAQTELAMQELVASSRRARAPSRAAPALADSTLGTAVPIRR
jgi:lipoprotein-anchoring transpeptidase ErfK/SrfK